MTEPKCPLDNKERKRLNETWPNHECQRLNHKDEEVAVDWYREETHESSWRWMSSNKRPTLQSIPWIFLVYGSCTRQLEEVKWTSKPSSHNWPTEIRFNVSLGIKYVSCNDKLFVEMWPICWTDMDESLVVEMTGKGEEDNCTEKFVGSDVIWLQQAESKYQEELPAGTEGAKEDKLPDLEMIW